MAYCVIKSFFQVKSKILLFVTKTTTKQKKNQQKTNKQNEKTENNFKSQEAIPGFNII